MTPAGATLASAGAQSPISPLALWREDVQRGSPAGIQPEVVQMAGRAAANFLEFSRQDPARARRAERVFSEGSVLAARYAPLMVVSRDDPATELQQFEVDVAGSRGLNYLVTLRAGFFASAMLPATCTCPDFVQGNAQGGPRKHMGAAWLAARGGAFGQLLQQRLAPTRSRVRVGAGIHASEAVPPPAPRMFAGPREVQPLDFQAGRGAFVKEFGCDPGDAMIWEQERLRRGEDDPPMPPPPGWPGLPASAGHQSLPIAPPSALSGDQQLPVAPGSGRTSEAVCYAYSHGQCDGKCGRTHRTLTRSEMNARDK